MKDREDFLINPARMGGLVKKTDGNQITIHLHGRLGVITIDRERIDFDGELEVGHELSFYFSYIRTMEDSYDYDSTALTVAGNATPCLVGGTLIEVNDTAVKVQLQDRIGTVAVPLRWLFSGTKPQVGDHTECYLSRMTVVGKREYPQEFI